MPWFRWRRRKDAAPASEPPAPAPPEELVTPPPVEAAAQPPAEGEETPRPKRRRGSRGGRSRRKQTTEQPPAASPEASAERPAGKKAEAPAARKSQAASERKGQAASERKPDGRSQRATRRRTPPERKPLPAAKRELLISVDVGEQRVAVVEDDKVAEVYLERPERRSIAGNIYKGSVDNVLPGMEAAFVEIGLERNGFLFVDEIVAPELEGRGHGRKIQDLLSRGQEVLVQAVKDPMKSKGARLTTEISLAGRFVVLVPHGEGVGVSRRLEDSERTRLRDILKALDLPRGGVIVRTAAEGASAEDVERDLVFLQRLWAAVERRAAEVPAPSLVYQEAELPFRVVRDVFTGDFERAIVDDELTHKRIVGYLKKTSPHLVERLSRYREKEPLFEAFGIDAEIRSTLSRRVDLPSGGYLIFDYAEAFTVIDVNTGRFTGSRSKSSGARLEDTITKNNLEAVKEVVRQLRVRDIGGIIVIDFIDMANPKNRALVEEALRAELERDRTKTYVVEISPLGLVEMTRQNVAEGPREILTKPCPTCAGEGIVVSETSGAVEIERRLRSLAVGARSQAFRVEVNARVASELIGPGAKRLAAIESRARRRFLLEPRDDVPVDHFVVLAHGKLATLVPDVPVEEGAEVVLKLVELGLHDAGAAVGKVDGYPVTVAHAAKLVGKKATVRVDRVLDGTAYGTLIDPAPRAEAPPPITAEEEAEKPTRRPPARKGRAKPEAKPAAALEPTEETTATDDEQTEDAEAPKRKTRRGSRGGRTRKTAAAGPLEATENEAATESAVPATEARIHVPEPDLGREAPDDDAVAVETPAPEGEEPAKPKRKSRRGTRGGRGRRRKTATENGGEELGSGAPAEPAAGDGEATGEWGYVPMSEWEEDFEEVGASRRRP